MLGVEVVETLGRQDEPASRPVRPVGVLLRTLVQPADFDDLLDQPPAGNTGLLLTYFNCYAFLHPVYG